MTYIWEVLLKADDQEFPRKSIRFAQTSTPSPYMEVAYEDLNRKYIDSEPIEINAYYRFSSFFDYLLDEALVSEHSEFQQVLYDILMHYAAEINMREGLCKKEYYGLFLREDVQKKKYGARYSEVFNTFPRKQIRFVVESMVRLYEIGPSVQLLKTVLRQLWPRSIIYLDAVDRRELLVYIGRRETPELNKQVFFLLDMFVPFDYVVHLFWELHFGIFGVNETLVIEEFTLY